MELAINIKGRNHLAAQLYHEIRRAILRGRLRPGERLPATRELARSLNVSRNTVIEAYERLASEGYLEARVGSGTSISRSLPGQPEASQLPRSSISLPVTRWAQRLVEPVYTPPQRDLPYDFRLGRPELSRFPVDLWNRISAGLLGTFSREFAYYGDSAGYRPLREAIARYLAHARAVVTDPDHVVITSGSQQALDLLARVLIEEGDPVVVEDPGYPAAVATFSAAGARITPVPVDDEGIRVELLPDQARLAYVTPSHQFPTGVPLSINRRMALLRWAQARRAVIIEDDYDSDFRYADRPIESLQGLDEANVVVYLGTFSKVLFPSLRLGYIVAPDSLLGAILAAKWIADRHTAALEQRIVATFMQEGHYQRYLRRMQRLYADRRKVLLNGLAHHTADWITPSPSVAGLHVTGWLPSPFDVDTLITRAEAVGVSIYSITPFFQGNPHPGLVFGFGACSSSHIREGIRRLANVLSTMKSSLGEV